MENEILIAEEKLKLAKKNLDECKFNNAIAYCKQALSYNPKNFEATLLLGVRCTSLSRQFLPQK